MEELDIKEAQKLSPDYKVLKAFKTKGYKKAIVWGKYAQHEIFLSNTKRVKALTVNTATDKKLFLENLLNDIHNNKYEYDVSKYKGNNCNIKVKCKKHGWFTTTYNTHRAGAGCPKCGRIRTGQKNKIPNKVLFKKVLKIHKDTYKYINVQKDNIPDKLEIICKKHGRFNQTLKSHSLGRGCIRCNLSTSLKHTVIPFEEFKERAELIHENWYSYDKSTYTNMQTKTKITCPIHGDFFQNPHNHISSKQGCPTCAKVLKSCTWKKFKGLSKINKFEELKQIPCFLYIVRLYKDNEDFIKIGVSSKNLENRLGRIAYYGYNVELLRLYKTNAYKALHKEFYLHNKFKYFKVTPKLKFGGQTECFSKEILDLVFSEVNLKEHKYYTYANTYKAFTCNNCGAVGRSRTNATPKEVKQALTISTPRA